jgi:hypothetical protein
MNSYTLQPVGFIRSTLKRREEAPRQRSEGAPDAWLEIEPQFAEAMLGMEVGHELIVITWLHQVRRDVLKGHPRNERPLPGGTPKRLSEVEPIEIHHLVPGRDKVVNKLLLRIGTGVDFGQCAELRV